LNRVVAFAAGFLRNCDLEIQEGPGQGLRFNTGGSAVSFVMGSSQQPEQLALKAMLAEGANFYDIGANVGFFTVIAARFLGPAGRIFCFEPLPTNHQQIRHNATLNGFTNIEIVETALGNIDGEASFWTSAEPTWGKLVSTGKVPDKMTGEIKVPVRRLDGIIAESGLVPPDAIKIDVEGAEVDVLLGAMETLRRYRPRLLIELHGTNAAVAELLSELDYKTTVVGDSASVIEAHWNASVAAIPAEAPWPAGLLAPCLEESAIGAST
jgi:FkbM family methyltransferase